MTGMDCHGSGEPRNDSKLEVTPTRHYEERSDEVIPHGNATGLVSLAMTVNRKKKERQWI